jgi:hypothetical protein
MISLSFILKFKTSNILTDIKHKPLKHTHGFYQLIWFTASELIMLTMKLITRKNSLIFMGTNQIHSFCPREQRRSPYPIQRFINQFNPFATIFSLSVFNEMDNPTSRDTAVNQWHSTIYSRIKHTETSQKATFFSY